MARELLSLIHLAGYSAYRAGCLLVRPLSLDAAFRLGEALGWCSFLVLRSRRALAMRNLSAALGVGRREARAIARRHFILLGANIISALKIATMSDKALRPHMDFEVAPEIPQGAHPPGWIAVLSHTGNWELSGRIAQLFPQYRFGALYRRLANPYADRHLRATRSKNGVRLFDRSTEFWGAVAFLESGGVLGILADQFAGNAGTWMPFFGRLTSTTTLPAALASRAGVKILPISVVTEGRARWRVKVGFPIDQRTTTEDTTAAINADLEDRISAAPADWLWTHNRWKTPHFGFLLTAAEQSVYLPGSFDRAHLKPYRLLVRSVDDAGELEASLRAVLAMAKGRPDVRLSIVAPKALASHWKVMPDVADVIAFGERESAWGVARKIRAHGPFDAGVLLPPGSRGAWEMLFGRVPYRLGPPKRMLLNNWKNPPGISDPPDRGPDRYGRIASAAGARI